MLENSTTIKAETVEKAIKLGLTKLGITEAEAEIRVISEGKRGLFGFGRQDAIVEVSQKEPKVVMETVAVEAEPVIEVTPEVTPVETILVEDVAVEETIEESKPIIETPKEVDESRYIVAKYLEDIIREYGAEAEVEVVDEGQRVTFNINTDKEGLIIGKHGKIINSLQILAQMLLHSYDRRRLSIVLNVGDYRNRRAEVLQQLAERTAEKVLRTKQPVILDSLPAYERKQIHAYISKNEHLTTHSEGHDPNRYLVVEYKY